MLTPSDGSLGPAHASVLDPLGPLAFVAGLTERIRIGTATICAPFLPPVVLAKALATLDVLSDGRVSAGVGSGWMPEEYACAGRGVWRRAGSPAASTT